MKELNPSRATFFGIFTIALSTLMYEVLLTRIFSVTMWYHFAFVAISVALFGMTVGALIVYLRPESFVAEKLPLQLARTALLFPISLVLSFLTQLSIPFLVHPSIVAIYAIIFTYAVIAVPFVVSGIAVSLILTRYTVAVGRLYAADLAGASLGCVLIIVTLELTDAPTAVFVVAFLASLGAVALAVSAGSRGLRRLSVAAAVALGIFVVGHTMLVWKQFPVLRILYVKGSFEARPLYEKWNSYSRVRVNGDPNRLEVPYAWGLSRTYPKDVRIHQLHLDIDVNAGTVILPFNGDFRPLEHLKYSVTNVGYHIRPDGDALIVGTGGGRDILSALLFGAKSVTGVELNRDIIETVTRRYGDFTGHLNRDPRVRFVNDEARSFVARDSHRYDFVQISLIDTWAATAAGAFVLSENSIYTTEAWETFLRRLTDRGVLSVSRWYFRKQPGEVYRMVTLATSALERIGVRDPRRHIVVVRNVTSMGLSLEERPDGVGTLLVSRTPFTAADLQRLREVSAAMDFDLVLTPDYAVDAVFAGLANGGDVSGIVSSLPINVEAPTDDSPFFFQMLRLKDIFDWRQLSQGKASHNMQAVFVLGTLLLTVVLLTGLCIGVPLAMKPPPGGLRGSRSLLLFFAAIGLGFMLIETSQMQRLIIVLGHPTYGLSVVLLALLLSSGLGSYSTDGVTLASVRSRGLRRLVVLLAVLAVFGVATPWVVQAFAGSTTPVRIAMAVLMLAFPGFMMGMAFPLGMTLAANHSPGLTPWLWGVNGAMSVLASVLSIAVALTWSISTAFWVGSACYAVAALAFFQASGARTQTVAQVASR